MYFYTYIFESSKRLVTLPKGVCLSFPAMVNHKEAKIIAKNKSNHLNPRNKVKSLNSPLALLLVPADVAARPRARCCSLAPAVFNQP